MKNAKYVSYCVSKQEKYKICSQQKFQKLKNTKYDSYAVSKNEKYKLCFLLCFKTRKNKNIVPTRLKKWKIQNIFPTTGLC